MTRTEKKALLLALIAENAATAGGFFTAHARRLEAEKNAAKVCRDMVAQGVLFRVRTGQTTYGYFSTQALADAGQRQHRYNVLARAANALTLTAKPGKPVPARAAAESFRPAHIRTQVYPTAAPRNQVIPLPAFIHNGFGAMR